MAEGYSYLGFSIVRATARAFKSDEPATKTATIPNHSASERVCVSVCPINAVTASASKSTAPATKAAIMKRRYHVKNALMGAIIAPSRPNPKAQQDDVTRS